MAIPSYNLIVITPQGVAYQGEVTHTRVPVEQGTIGVLADHAPLVTSSSGGVLEIRENNGGEKNFFSWKWLF
jgi:F-type H+-transporting ATPase subunit epsilon